ncbi:MAG: metallophosphoesterase [Candidatus Micrarchaeota archaeon]
MRVLFAADAHAEIQAIDFLKQFWNQEKPEALVFVGDFTQVGPIDYARDFINEAKQLTPNFKAIPGNNDTEAVRELMREKGIDFHAQAIDFHGFKLVGFGGSNPTPFNTVFEYEDEELYDSIAKLTDSQSIVVSHAPPFNSNADKLHNGFHAGCKSLRKLIEEKQPRACICAHIHENEGVETIGKTKIIKVAPLMHGKAALVDLNTLHAKFLSIK